MINEQGQFVQKDEPLPKSIDVIELIKQTHQLQDSLIAFSIQGNLHLNVAMQLLRDISDLRIKLRYHQLTTIEIEIEEKKTKD